VLPCFSRDGTKIAFVGARGGSDNEICVNGLSSEKTSPVRVITSNTLDDFWPSWVCCPVLDWWKRPR
jgi:Tol biopolymer transport system component